jgi:single-stranded-DNA-specific exonuclease
MKYRLRKEIPSKVSESLKKYSNITKTLLHYRDISNEKDADLFLNYDPSYINDPLTMKGIRESVERINLAISNNEKICIFADYDADGIPGAVVFSDFFKEIKYKNVEVYFPHRNIDGFSLNIKAIEELAERGTNLIVTIDCGITDVKEVDLANEKNIDVIITDHHEIGEEVPNAYAIVNPKQPGCEYKEKMLCGSAVIFKLTQALIRSGKHNIDEYFDKTLLDMVGIATLSDMVPLIGENRLFAHYGLLMLRQSTRPGLQKLLKKAGCKQEALTGEDVVFSITPKINAASRMGHPIDAYTLLSTKDEALADQMVKKLDKMNNERKGSVAAMVRSANKKMAEFEEIPNVIIVGDVDWKPSLVGLVASSLVDKYKRPAFVWGREDASHIKGSCRGVGDVSLHSIMTEAKDVFNGFGGHFNAGGFETDNSKVHDMEKGLNDAYAKCLKEKQEIIEWVDHVLSPEEVNNNLYNDLNKLSPFGDSNPKPVFLFKKVIVHSAEDFGKEKNHVKIKVKRSNGWPLEAITFFKTLKDYDAIIEPGTEIDMIATVENSNFAGRSSLRLKIVDVLKSGEWK